MKHRNYLYICWLYLGLLLFLAVVRLMQKIIVDTGGFASRYFPLIITIIIVVGVIGYTLQKPILKRWFWMTYFWLISFTTAAIAFFSFYVIVVYGAKSKLGLGMLSVALILLPALSLLYKYAFKSQVLWQKSVKGNHLVEKKRTH